MTGEPTYDDQPEPKKADTEEETDSLLAIKSGPEAEMVRVWQQANVEYINRLYKEFPPIDRSSMNRMHISGDGMWGFSIAVACAQLGVPLGFENDRMEGAPTYTAMRGSNAAIDYFLYIAGYEHRLPGRGERAAVNEPRSGYYTLLDDPVHKEIFEHIYAEYTGQSIEDVIYSDPDYEPRRKGAPAVMHEIIDHAGVAAMYAEDPDHCLRLFLTRQLPVLKYLRDHIEHTQRTLSFADGVSDEDRERFEPRLVEMLDRIAAERREMRGYHQAHLERMQMQYDFTLSLLMEGYKPYTLEEIVPFTMEYLLGLLAVHPELSPSDLQTEIPDMKDHIQGLLADTKRRGLHADNRDRAKDN